MLLKWKNLMLFFVEHDNKLKSFGFLDCWSDKTYSLKMSPWPPGNYMLHYFLTFLLKKNINQENNMD